MKIQTVEQINEKLYYKNPTRCMDCKKELPFEIGSNKRCTPCYDIERKRKYAFVNDNLEW